MELLWLNEQVAVCPALLPEVLPAELDKQRIQALVRLTPLSLPELPGITGLQLQLPQQTPPQDTALEVFASQLPQALGFIAQQPGKVLVAGHADVLGVMAAVWLMQQGTAPLPAVAQVRALWDGALSDDGWDQFVFDVLYRMQD